jgi:hypothetical protein
MKKARVLFVLVILLVAASYGGFQLYERHLSSNLKRTLVAALDQSATDADILVYVREARLQVRTEKDKATLSKLEKMLQLAQDAQEIEQRHWQKLTQRQEEMTMALGPYGDKSNYPCWMIEKVTGAAKESFRKACQDQVEKNNAEEKAMNDENQTAQKARDNAQKLNGELHADLGLPPAKTP